MIKRVIDYTDKYSIKIFSRKPVTPQEIFDVVFSNYPIWVKMLFDVRNRIVKLFGLKSSLGFKDFISESTPKYILINKDDKHLSVSIMLECDNGVGDNRIVSILTAVKYHNRLGKIYFYLIKPFHKLLCKMALSRAKQNVQAKKNDIYEG